LGTPYYMSPEQAEGAKSVDHRSDIWAMGVIAWECLLGVRPFEAETLGGLLLAICARDLPIPSRVGAVPAGFDAWFARACSRDISQRFATAKEAASELRNVCAGQLMAGNYALSPASGPMSGPVAQAASLPLASTTAHLGLSAPSSSSKKSVAPWVLLGVLGAGALGAGAFFALRGGERPDAAPSAALPAAAAPTPPAASTGAAAVAVESPKPVADAAPVASVALAASVAPPTPAPVLRAPARIKPHAAAVAVEKPKPAAAVAPAPATPAVTATPKPRVNLGI
jgi:serine/threonine-protein kinase